MNEIISNIFVAKDIYIDIYLKETKNCCTKN